MNGAINSVGITEFLVFQRYSDQNRNSSIHQRDSRIRIVDMRKRALVVLLGLSLITVLVGLLILNTIIGNNNTEATRQATIKAIYLTNTAVAIEIHACDVIRSTLRLHNVCGDEIRFWTPEPSPTNPLINPIQVSATAIQETQRALGTVLAACATLKNSSQDNIEPCPRFGVSANTRTPPAR
jgi:hypothetical protein